MSALLAQGLLNSQFACVRVASRRLSSARQLHTQRKCLRMLRITVHYDPRVLTFQLEGDLAGPFVPELESCWRNSLTSQPATVRRVDLTGVTSIDEAGRACLAKLHRLGAEFITADCLIDAIVSEIVQSVEKSSIPSGQDAGEGDIESAAQLPKFIRSGKRCP